MDILNINRLNDGACIIFALFALTIVIQLTYYLVVYVRVALRKEKAKTSPQNDSPPVSVIICARNEEEHLRQNLKLTLEQDYLSYEVIVVNDCSEDDTEQVLMEFKQKYPHLRSTIIKKDGSFLNSRKFAAAMGVKAAQHEWLLFTGADCRPESPQWITSMSKYFVEGKGIVLGYGGYLPQKGYLNKWIRYDSFFAALQYLGFAMMGKAYTGVGRNLAYRKSLFFEHNGFAKHAHVASGDDGLFVNQASDGHNVAVMYDKNAHTRALPTKSFKDWLWLKKKISNTGKYFKNCNFFRLTLEPVSRLLMWASFCVLLFMSQYWHYILILFMLRMIVFMSVIGLAARRLNEPAVLQHAVIFDLLMPFINFYVFLLSRISSKQNKWK